MPSTFSTNLKIELMSTGENSGTWGTVTNTNLGTALEQAVVGYGNPNYSSDANLTITLTDTNAAQAARALVLNVTSGVSLSATRELVVPTIQKQYIVQNNTTGSQSITVKTSAGTGVTIPNGKKMHVYVNGTDVVQMDDFALIFNVDNLTLDGNTLSSTNTNGNIVLAPNGTGDVQLDADTVRIGDSNANATITTNGTGDLILNTNSGTNSGSITIEDGVNGNIIIAPNGTGQVQISNAALDLTTIEVTNIKAKDGTASMTLADTTGNVTVSSAFAANGGVTIGDASGDAFTINSSAVSTPNGLNFDSNTLVIDAANDRVGVGTATPSVKFDVAGVIRSTGTNANLGGTATTGNAQLALTTNARIWTLYTANSSSGLQFRDETAGLERMQITPTGQVNIGGNFTSTNNTLQVTGNAAIGYTTAAPTTGLIVAGNVGIGTDSPGYKLQVSGTSGQTFSIERVASSIGSSTSLGTIVGTGEIPTLTADGASIQFLGAGLWSATSAPGRIVFNTTPVSTTTPVERFQLTTGEAVVNDPGNDYDFRVESDNNTHMLFVDAGNDRVGIGQASPARTLDVYGSIQAADASGIQTVLWSQATAGAGGVGTNNNFPFTLLTNGSVRATLDSSGNLGLGVTPSAWTVGKVLQVGTVSAFWDFSNNTYLTNNRKFESGNKYIANGYATSYEQSEGKHLWLTAASGTAGDPITFTTPMTLDASGNLLVGGTSNALSARALLENASGNQIGLRYTGVATYYNSVDSSGNLIWTKDGTERARITSGGDLLVGTTSGSAKIVAVSAVAADAAAFSDGSNYTLAVRRLPSATGGMITGTAGSAIGFGTDNTERARIDAAGNLGLGVTPSAWGGFGVKAFDVSTGASFSGSGSDAGMIANAYYDGSNWRYKATSPSIRYQQIIGTGEHAWFNAPSGTAGNTISFTQAMTLDASGNLGIGITNPAVRLAVNGAARVGANVVGQYVEFSHDTANGLLSTNTGALGYSAPSFHYWSIGGTERARITSGGNFGVGTTSPIAFSNQTSVTVNGTNTGRFDLKVGDTHTGALVATSTYVDLTAITNIPLTFGTNAAERARITSDGQVLIGANTSSWSSTYTILQLVNGSLANYSPTKDFRITSNAYSNSGWKYLANGSSSQILLDGSSTNGVIAFYSAATGTAGNATTNGVNAAGDTVLSVSRTNSVALEGALSYAGTGITFPATQSASSNANTLDDYEEGLHTAVITTGTSGTVTLSSIADRLAYTKVGRQVTVIGGLTVDSVSSPVGFFYVSLPFAIGDLDEVAGRASGSVTIIDGNGPNVADFVVLALEGETSFRVYLGDAASVQADSANALQAGTQIYVSFTYFV